MDSTQFRNVENTASQIKKNNGLLIHAIVNNDKKRLKPLLENTPLEQLNTLLMGEYTPINYCVSQDYLSLIPLLVHAGMDIDSTAHDDKKHEGLVNPVIYTALHAPIKALKLLIKLGAIIDFNDKQTQDTFILLAKYDAKSQLSFFLTFGENISTDIVSLLIDNSENEVDLFQNNIQDVIDCFIKKQDLQSIESILSLYKKRLDLDMVIGASVFTASESGSNEILSFLIQNYDHFIDSFHYEDAFDIAVTHNLDVCVSILLEKIDVISFEVKLDCLMAAIQSCHIDTLDVLLQHENFEILVEENAADIYSFLQKNVTKNEFSLIFDKFIKIEGFKIFYDNMKKRIDSLYNSLSPNHSLQGPLNKDFFTRELEWIAKYTLRNPNECVYSIEKNRIYVYINKTSINLSKLIQQSELSHIVLSEEDSFYFSGLTSLPPEMLDFLKKPLPKDYLLPKESLTDSEKLAVYYYSGEGSTVINSILYGNPDKEEIAESSDVFNAFLNIIFLASALNKIMPSWTRDPESLKKPLKSFRGEEHTPHEELKKRSEQLQAHSEGIIQKQSGFTSTSSKQQVAISFAKKLSCIEYAELYGKNIQPLSLHKHEKEYLQLPCRIHFEQVTQDEDISVFQAKVVTPLYKKYRSTQQEYRFKHLSATTHSTNLLPYLIFDAIQPALIDGLLKECQFIYKHYLSLSFTEDWIDVDWELVTPYGIIPRPNHGLAHTMRVAHLVPIVAESLQHHDNRFHFTGRVISIVQLAALFSVVGRKNEAGFKDMQLNKSGYRVFKQNSAQAFSDYVRKKQFLNMTEKEIELYSGYILKMGEPGENDPAAILLALAHKLDLLRCYEPERVENDIIKPLNQYFPAAYTEQLMNYAENLLHATENRVLFGKNVTDYDPELFYKASTNVKFCYQALIEVAPPVIEPINLPSTLPFAKEKALKI